MKSIIYLIAILAIAAGGWFSYGVMNDFAALKEKRVALYEQNTTSKTIAKKAKKEAAEMAAKRDKAKEALFAVGEDGNAVKSNYKLSKRQEATLKKKIARLVEKIKAAKQLEGGVDDGTDELGEGVSVEDIPKIIEKLEADLEATSKKLEETEALSAAAKKRIVSSKDQVKQIRERVVKRAAHISANRFQGRITAVNHDWGFAIVRVPSGMPINEASKLIIKRGDSYIGKLKVTSIERGRIITDVDYKSMKAGLVAQPGDTVILEKPLTN